MPPVLAPVAPGDGALEWTFTVPAQERVRVILEASHNRSGNPFEIRLGDQVLKGFLPGTRNTPVLVEAGIFELEPGVRTLSISNLPSAENIYMSVHSVLLRPESSGPVSLPDLRAEIARRRAVTLPGELLMPAIFSDHMVLQRGIKVPVWGLSEPERTVKVVFNGQSHEAIANSTGRWRVDLDPMAAGGPHAMEISDGKKTIRIADVLVGEVWFGSGQSNMEVSYYLRQGREVKTECDEETRRLLEDGANGSIRISALTRDHSRDAAWTVLTKENCLDAPALMSSAAILLNQKLGIPVGLIIRCESSSPACIWLSRDAVERAPAIQNQLKDYAQNVYPKLMASYPAALEAWQQASEKAGMEGRQSPKRPMPPTPAGAFPGDFEPATQRREYPGANFDQRIRPVIPFAVRGIVWDQGEGGTGMAGVDQTALLPALVREWRAAWGRENLPFVYIGKKVHPPGLENAILSLPDTAVVPYQGLKTDNHPPDKAAYAGRLVERMEIFTLPGSRPMP